MALTFAPLTSGATIGLWALFVGGKTVIDVGKGYHKNYTNSREARIADTSVPPQEPKGGLGKSVAVAASKHAQQQPMSPTETPPASPKNQKIARRHSVL